MVAYLGWILFLVTLIVFQIYRNGVTRVTMDLYCFLMMIWFDQNAREDYTNQYLALVESECLNPEKMLNTTINLVQKLAEQVNVYNGDPSSMELAKNAIAVKLGR